MPVGGSIREIHLAGRTFSVAADGEVERVLGGAQNEVRIFAKSSTVVQSIRPWALRNVVVSIDPNLADHEFLQAIANGSLSGADSNGFYSMSITYVLGEEWVGVGTIVDEPAHNSHKSTCTLNLSGPPTINDEDGNWTTGLAQVPRFP